jgi:hypothetical protein
MKEEELPKEYVALVTTNRRRSRRRRRKKKNRETYTHTVKIFPP